MADDDREKNLPAVRSERSAPRRIDSASRRGFDGETEFERVAGFEDADEFEREPPIRTVIDSHQLKDRIVEYLGAVLARCWFDKNLLDDIAIDPHRALRHVGILLPDEIDIKVERPHKERPRLVIYEYNRERTFRRRICYIQLIMMAGA